MVTLWDITAESMLISLPANALSPNSENAFIDNNVQDVKFHPNGEILYAVSTDGTVRAWETDIWQVLETQSFNTTTTEARFTGVDRRLVFSQDNIGADAFDIVTINAPPVAAGTASLSLDANTPDPFPRNGGTTITLDASASDDPDGSIMQYTWARGGITVAITPDPVIHTSIRDCASLDYVLTVTDDDGATDTVTVPLSAEDFC